MEPFALIPVEQLSREEPVGRLVEGVDLVALRDVTDSPRFYYGRCQHRGALLADGHLEGQHLVCTLHGSTYDSETGRNVRFKGADLQSFTSWVEGGTLYVDASEVRSWRQENPQPFDRSRYQGTYAPTKGIDAEPHVASIQSLAERGLDGVGHHGEVAAMGVPRQDLPQWDDIQLLTAQLDRPPLLDDAPVTTDVVIGPGAARPLDLAGPLLVSDMSFGALSAESKVAMARGAERAGTGICSGEGGVHPEEHAENSRYLYELASGRFGFSQERVSASRAFHFKLGQAAKTGTGGHLPGHKVTPEIAEVRGLVPGQDAISPSRFVDLTTPADFAEVAAEIREFTGGIPVGVKLSAQHIEQDLDAALAIGVDYVILDGRGGGTGAAPLLFRDNISMPTIPALSRARRHLDASGADDVSLIITGGLRVPADFIKALALGADAVALANSAMQAIGCVGMRACHTNSCPVGIATQKPHLRSRLPVEEASQRLARFITSSVHLMTVMARACGHDSLRSFTPDDLTSWNPTTAALAGIDFAGPDPDRSGPQKSA
ncbi:MULTISPECIES: glutamate synthase-related protein [Actinomycetes]|uniref:Glutamate synthase-related protein n=2 Tax=Actinomycetes TaxID=1760 RepID=A0ABP6LSI6_9MICC